ncbi:chemosensory receptor [Aphelenchoides avenae]|nr:chemosensory receptor [Aphelenchus avenae]
MELPSASQPFFSTTSLLAVVPLIYMLVAVPVSGYIYLEIAYWIVLYVCLRASTASVFAPVYASLPTTGWLPRTAVFVTQHLAPCSYLLNLFLHINRLSVFLFPLRYRQLWRRLLPLSVVVSMLLPLVATWDMLLDDAQLVYVEGAGMYLFLSTSDKSKFNHIFTTICSLTYGATVVAMEGAVIAFLITRRHCASLALLNDTRDSEVKLCLVAVLMCLAVAVTFLTQLYQSINDIRGSGTDPSVRTKLNLMQMYMFDVSVAGSPWLLVAMSRAVREELAKTIARRSNSVSHMGNALNLRVVPAT